jgi:SAM-dependent methyltransferase
MAAKQEYDLAAAGRRPVCFDKAWYQATRNTLSKLNWKGGTVLNLGCGNNELSVILRDEFGATVTATDVVPSFVENAKNMGFESFPVDIDSKASRLKTQKLYGGKFDLIVSTAVIEHIFDTNAYFQLCHRLLKEGGYLLLTTPNVSYLGNRIYSELRGGAPLCANNHHITFWSFKHLYVYFRCYGFTDVRNESQYFPERYTTSRLKYLVGRTISRCLEKFYDVIGKFQKIGWMKSFVTNELVVVGRKTDKHTFYFPLTLLDIDAMSKPKKQELLSRCADMEKAGALKYHPGCYKRYLDLRENCK